MDRCAAPCHMTHQLFLSTDTPEQRTDNEDERTPVKLVRLKRASQEMECPREAVAQAQRRRVQVEGTRGAERATADGRHARVPGPAAVVALVPTQPMSGSSATVTSTTAASGQRLRGQTTHIFRVGGPLATEAHDRSTWLVGIRMAARHSIRPQVRVREQLAGCVIREAPLKRGEADARVVPLVRVRERERAAGSGGMGAQG